MQTQNVNQDNKTISNSVFEKMRHNLNIEPVATYDYLTWGKIISMYTLYRNPEYLEYYLQYSDDCSIDSVITLLTPQEAKETIAIFEAQQYNPSSNSIMSQTGYRFFDGYPYGNKGQVPYVFKDMIDSDIQEANTVSLIQQVKRLKDKVEDNELSVDSDTILADMVDESSDNGFMNQSGLSQDIFDLYKDHANRHAVEQMFLIFTGEEFKDYLGRCTTEMTKELENIEPSKEDIELD